MNHPMGPLGWRILLGWMSCDGHHACAGRKGWGSEVFALARLLKKYVAAGWLDANPRAGFYSY